MKTFFNTQQARHAGRQEMFRGRMVDCHEVPARFDFVMAELIKRPLGELLPPGVSDIDLDAILATVHTEPYLTFLEGAWAEWVAMDPANAHRDALPSVWPMPRLHGFRTDVLPQNFAARLGAFAFDSGCPLTEGTWGAARQGAACAMAAAQEVANGARSAFALTRPPGHHAGPENFGGYCFINNAPEAAQT
ncbi:MAG: histone deacetylase family protein, partial [Hydrogenophaga sp.]